MGRFLAGEPAPWPLTRATARLLDMNSAAAVVGGGTAASVWREGHLDAMLSMTMISMVFGEGVTSYSKGINANKQGDQQRSSAAWKERKRAASWIGVLRMRRIDGCRFPHRPGPLGSSHKKLKLLSAEKVGHAHRGEEKLATSPLHLQSTETKLTILRC